ncbi:hypothetical protein [Sporomusa sp.]|uniref:hypothetical protein n=1 Tax=Sporomusa sp. TaxID=2078658 RepID=UPI002B56136C|nr:hypothetical protein [Sporomusa sp.]HWR43561.1 hypothetical protein [Sporomusa sp.]
MYSTETDSQKPDFAEDFEVILPVKQANGPWEYEQPLKSRPKVFEDNHLAE